MKKLLSVIGLMLLWATSAFSYDIQMTGDIPLADNLTGIAVNPSTNTAAAVSSETNILYLIDVTSNAVAKKIPLDITPAGVAIDVKRNQAIVSSSDGELRFIGLDTGFVSRSFNILTSQPPSFSTSLALNPETDTLYIANGSSIEIIDLQTGNIIKEASLSDAVTGMAIDNNLGYLVLLLTSDIGSRVSVYNTETLAPISSGISTSQLPNFPSSGFSGISVNPSTHIAVLTNKSDNSISIISLENKTALDTISINEQPNAIAIDSTNNTAFISRKNGIAVIKLENPVPKINLLIPDSARSGGSGLMLSIEGDKFVQDSQAQFDKKDVPTYFKTNESLQAHISKEDLTNPGDVPVTVTNPQPGGGISNALLFSIFDPAPVLDSITPDAIALPLAAGAATLRVKGRNFFNGSIVNLDGENLRTRFISSILLEAEIAPSLIKSPKQYPVVVINPWPGAYTSRAVYLNVTDDNSDAQTPSETGDTGETGKLGDGETGKSGTLKGRILNTDKEPLEGITIRTKGLSTRTDANGYFRLDHVPAGKRHVMIHGETAKETGAHYPTIPLTIDIQANVTNEMPFQIYLHRQKDKSYKSIDHNKAAKMMGDEAPVITTHGDIIVTDPEVPGFEMMIPEGVKITGWDGKPNKKVSVRTVPIDRLPVKPLPPNAGIRTIYMFHFNKIGGGIPDRPIPIKAKNDLGLLPGEKAVLWYYDESPIEGEAPNDWAIAGTGTVTPDGTYIVSDTGVGMPKFCCGAGGFGGPGGGTSPGPPTPDCALGGGQ